MDNLKQLEQSNATVHDPGAPVQGISVASVRDLNKEFISKIGKYTGLPFVSKRLPIDGVVPAGNLFWNTNSMNKNTAFQLFISNTTLDANRTSRIFDLLKINDLIHFKDYVGRSTFLKYLNHSVTDDSVSNSYLIVDVVGFTENTNYAYLEGESEICQIEFFKTSNAQVFTTEENSKIWNTGDPRTFDMTTLSNPSLKPMMVFQSGAKLKRGSQWTFNGTTVTIDDSVELFNGDDITFPGIINQDDIVSSTDFGSEFGPDF